jgi:DNA-binding CsgD family transcriptional regulator
MGIEDIHGIFEELTPRQVEIFTLVGEGKTSGEIAGELGISESTVQNHRDNIVHILDLEGYNSLYHLAIEVRFQRNGGVSSLKEHIAIFVYRVYLLNRVHKISRNQPNIGTIWVLFG